MERAAIILAGGDSTRFGPTDKALAPIEGTPMIRHVGDRIVDTIDELVVNCRTDQQYTIETALDAIRVEPKFAIDPVPHQGPVAGLRTALRRTRSSVAFVTACDMPGLDSRFVDILFQTAAGVTGVVPVFEGERQPLAAVYRTGPTEHVCRRTLSDGCGSFRALLDRLHPAILHESRVRELTTPATFRNVNTPDDLAAVTLEASDR